MSRGCTVAVNFASLIMADVLMMVLMMDNDGRGWEKSGGWCLMKLRASDIEEVAMHALL